MARSSSPLRSFRLRDTGIGCLRRDQTYHFIFIANCVLFCSEKYLPKETGKERDDTIVCEEERILAKQRAPCLERFELSLEFLDANDAVDELDACLLKKIFVFALWVFGNEADSRVAGIDKRVLDRAIHCMGTRKYRAESRRTFYEVLTWLLHEPASLRSEAICNPPFREVARFLRVFVAA